MVGLGNILVDERWPKTNIPFGLAYQKAVFMVVMSKCSEYYKTHLFPVGNQIPSPIALMNIIEKQVSGHANEARRQYQFLLDWMSDAFQIRDLANAPAELEKLHSTRSNPLLEEFREHSLEDFVRKTDAVMMLMQLQQLDYWREFANLALQKAENYKSCRTLKIFMEHYAPTKTL